MQLLRRPQIGKIVDGRPPGVTQCLDGKWSTYRPGRGVCSHHSGWRGTSVKEEEVAEAPEKFLVANLDSSIPGVTEEDQAHYRAYLKKIYTDIKGIRTAAQQKEFSEVWRRFVAMYTKSINNAFRAKLVTKGRERATTEKGKSARRGLNRAIRDFERNERTLYKVLRYDQPKYGNVEPVRATLLKREKESSKRESGTYYGNTPDDFRPWANLIRMDQAAYNPQPLDKKQLQRVIDDILLHSTVNQLNQAIDSYDFMSLAMKHKTRQMDNNPGRYIGAGRLQERVWAIDVSDAIDLYLNQENLIKAKETLEKMQRVKRNKNLPGRAEKYNALAKEHNRLVKGTDKLIDRFEALHAVEKNKQYKRKLTVPV